MSVLVIAEHQQGELAKATRHTVAAALKLGDDVRVLVAGQDCSQVAQQVAKLSGVKRVLCADNVVYAHSIAQTIAGLVAKLAKDYRAILFPSTTFGKNIMPRVAALLNIQPLSDVIEIIDDKTFKRPIYAGNALATVQSSETINIMTIRTTAFAMVSEQEQLSPIDVVDIVIPVEGVEFVSEEVSESERPELTNARVVVSGGRGLGSAENFKLIEECAELLNAAIGATRAAVDADYIHNEFQVGQTGKVVAPELYIAVGISGAIQHLAGMKDSKVIVAINKDPDAPIFQVADYGLVGDLFAIMPELNKKLAGKLSS